MADERWLTYDEVADARATSRDAAVRWVQRRKLRRQPGNDGRVRVLVPPTCWMTRTPQIDPAAPPNGVTQGALDTLRQQLVRADARADEANKRADVAVALADRTLAQLAEAHTERAAAQARAERAEALVTDLEADVAAKEQAITEERSRANAAQIAQAEAEADAAELRQAASERQKAARAPWLATTAEKLHYRNGWLGKLARAVLRLRAGGDPAEYAVVLVPIIVVIAGLAADAGDIGAWALYLAIGLPPLVAGGWMGVVLGADGQLRITLRSVLIGAIEGALYQWISWLMDKPFDKHQALKDLVAVIFVNLVFFWFWGLMGGLWSDILTISETTWRDGESRRALIKTVIRAVFGGEELKNLSTPVLVIVWSCRAILPIIGVTYLLSVTLGIGFVDAFKLKWLPAAGR